MSKAIQTISELICLASDKNLIKKAVFSKPADRSVVKAVASVRLIKGEKVIQIETFTTDNKAIHRNLPVACAQGDISSLCENFMQINLITEVGDCEYRASKSGNSTVIGESKLRQALSTSANGGEIMSNNNQKDYILKGDEPFLKLLGISDINGRIHDKKQSKFRQINRFLEHIRDILKYLPDGDIRICDLCCGKSYLSFAVYHYFANVLGKKVSMTGVDLKQDVIDYCSSVAIRLGFEGLDFVCGDITQYECDVPPQLVISLHACDTATDIVLEKASEWGAKVILSTPCCHHELNHKLDCPELEFIAKYSMLRQKLCDAATDAMRLSLLEAKGYDTDALELIDPDETPKNILLRAIKKRATVSEPLMQKYREIRHFLMKE